jgi:APA family basic amino acid/polyamine antiporter
VPIVPLTSAVACVALMTNLAIETWLRFLVWLVLGLVVYLAYGRRHSKLGQAEAAGASGASGKDASLPG